MNRQGNRPRFLRGSVCRMVLYPVRLSDLVTDLHKRSGLFVSTSKLQRYTSSMLSLHLGQYTIRENTRPNWLRMPDGTRLELDFFIEEILVAIEVQGQQHYVYTPHFHSTYDDFRNRLERDRFKRDCCLAHGITFVEIASKQDVKDFVFSHTDITRPDPTEIRLENTEKIQELYREYMTKRKLRRKLTRTYNRNRKRGIKCGTQKHLMRTVERLREIKTVLRKVVGEEALR